MSDSFVFYFLFIKQLIPILDMMQFDCEKKKKKRTFFTFKLIRMFTCFVFKRWHEERRTIIRSRWHV